MYKVLQYKVGFAAVPWDGKNFIHFASVSQALETIDRLYGIMWAYEGKQLNFKRLEDDIKSSLTIDFQNIAYSIEDAMKFNYCVIETTEETFPQQTRKSYSFWFVSDHKQVSNARTCLSVILTKDPFTTYPGWQVKSVLTERLHRDRFVSGSKRSKRDYDLSMNAPASRGDVLDGKFEEREIKTYPKNLEDNSGLGDPFDSLRWAYFLIEKISGGIDYEKPSDMGYVNLSNGASVPRPYKLVCIPFFGRKKLHRDPNGDTFEESKKIVVKDHDGNVYPLDPGAFAAFINSSSSLNSFGWVSEIPPFRTSWVESCTYDANNNIELVMADGFLGNTGYIFEKMYSYNQTDAYVFNVAIESLGNITMTENPDGIEELLTELEVYHLEPKLLNSAYASYDVSIYGAGSSTLNIFNCGFERTNGIMTSLPSFTYKGPYMMGGDGIYSKLYITSGKYEYSFLADEILIENLNISPYPMSKNKFIEWCATNYFSVITGSAAQTTSSFATGTGGKEYYPTEYKTMSGPEFVKQVDAGKYSMSDGIIMSDGTVLASSNQLRSAGNGLSGMSEGAAAGVLHSAIQSLGAIGTAALQGTRKTVNKNLLAENDSNLTEYSYFKTMLNKDMKTVSDFYFKFGYLVDMITDSTEWFGRTVFNYVKIAEDCTDKMGTNMTVGERRLISNLLQSGITFWEPLVLEKDQNRPFVYEGFNWEKNLDNDEEDPYWRN